MSRWFRFYEEAINDDKVRCLSSDTLRWQWVVLLTVASKYSGKIPSLTVAAENLRLKPAKAAEVVAALARAGLLDKVEGGYFRAHNWTGRQPTDATAAERKRRQRERERDNRDSHGVTTVTVTPLEERERVDDDGNAGARAKQPWELEPCHDLARQLAEIAGCANEFDFTGWGGATYRVKQWLENGWKTELIVASVREQAARKRDGPAKSIKYFEPGIASAIAKANQPLPSIVEIPRSRHETSDSKSGLAAIDRIFDRPEMRSAVGQTADETVVLSLPAGPIQRP